MSDTAGTSAQTRKCPFAPPEDQVRILHSDTVHDTTVYGIKSWQVARAEDVELVTNDPRFSSRTALQSLPNDKSGWFSGMDWPEHNRYRRKIARDFTVRNSRELQARTEEVANELLDRIEAAGTETDLVATYANPLPRPVISALYGMTEYEARTIEDSVASIAAAVADKELLRARRESFFAYSLALVRKKRAEQGDGLLHRLLATQGDEAALTVAEAVGVFGTLLAGGSESIHKMLAYSVYALLRHPDQLALLQENPDLIDSAIEELLRFLPVTKTGIPRVAVEDLVLRGKQISAGDFMLPLYSAANRDAGVFVDPDRFDITREQKGHYAFGHGIHKCPAQHFTRMLLKVGVVQLLKRFPDLKLQPGHEDVPMLDTPGFYCPAELRVTWGPGEPTTATAR
jgi:cytochrome P450 C-9 hydroxylase